MQWQGLKIHILIIALVIGLTLFLGGQWVYNKVSYQEPLNKTLDDLECVSSYSIDDSSDELLITVKFKEPVNLIEDYMKVESGVEEIMNGRKYEIKLQDNPDEKLKKAYYDSQFVIHEAIVRGNFREMAQVVHSSAEEFDSTAKIYVGAKNIYLQMNHDRNCLYKVIPRQSELPGKALN